MLKKLLAVSIAILMICSSMAVVSFADTSAEPQVIQEWVEDFDSYTDEQLSMNDQNTLYKANSDPCHSKNHYHLKNDWIIGDYNGGTYLFEARHFKIKDAGRGKLNSDKALVWDFNGWAELGYMQNAFGGTPIALTSDNAVGVSYDWFNQSTQNHGNHINLYPTIQAYVTFTNGTETYENVLITIATNSAFQFQIVSGTNVNVQSTETWNKVDARITKDKIYVRANTDSNVVAFDVSGYNPSTGDWVSESNNSGFEISSVSSIRIYNPRGNYGQSGNSDHGFDNLRTYVMSGDASSIAAPAYSNFMDFSAIMQTENGNGEGDGKKFLLADGNGNASVSFALSENQKTGYPITVAVMEDDTTVKATRYADGFLKISNTAGTSVTGSPLCYIKQDTATQARAALGDKVQYSFDFKIAGNENAPATSRWIELATNQVTGGDECLFVSGNGLVYDPDNSKAYLAKLQSNRWYTLDTEYELTEDGTIAKIYLDGQLILTKTIDPESFVIVGGSINWACRLTYRNVANADGTAYLENSACFDNFSYRILKGGVNAYNFDKSASLASNKAIANADIDFENGTIFPVAEDFTVADFKALGLANATVLEAADNDALAGKVIKFTGDYGKDVYFTVSSEGGENVTKNSFVTLREELGTTFATSATAGKLLTAKAIKDGANLEVYVAEYANGELVGLTVGKGVANYTPKTAGNTIKVFIWADGTLVPAFSGAASELSVN